MYIYLLSNSQPIQTYRGSRQISVLHATRNSFYEVIILVDTTHYTHTQLCLPFFGCRLVRVSVTVSIAGLLVMVSSELVVLLIVCVGINTGSAQQEGELTTIFS